MFYLINITVFCDCMLILISMSATQFRTIAGGESCGVLPKTAVWNTLEHFVKLSSVNTQTHSHHRETRVATNTLERQIEMLQKRHHHRIFSSCHNPPIMLRWHQLM